MSERPTIHELEALKNSELMRRVLFDKTWNHLCKSQAIKRLACGELPLENLDNEVVIEKFSVDENNDGDPPLRAKCIEMYNSGCPFSESNDPEAAIEFLSESGDIRDKRFSELTEQQKKLWKFLRKLYRLWREKRR